MHIGLDLDETIVELSSNGYVWKFKHEASHYMRLLTEQGHQLHIITARSNSMINVDQVEEIIQSLEKQGICIQDVTYTFGTPKGTFARDLQCICLVDDHPPYLEDCLQYNVKPILLSDISSQRDYPNWRVASNWREIYAHILSFEEQILLNME
jgi:hypothetical protein